MLFFQSSAFTDKRSLSGALLRLYASFCSQGSGLCSPMTPKSQMNLLAQRSGSYGSAKRGYTNSARCRVCTQLHEEKGTMLKNDAPLYTPKTRNAHQQNDSTLHFHQTVHRQHDAKLKDDYVKYGPQARSNGADSRQPKCNLLRRCGHSDHT